MDVTVENSADEESITVRTRNDDITLEYNDIIILEFTPDDPSLIEFLEEDGQYIRDTVIVRIIDNDSKPFLFSFNGQQWLIVKFVQNLK